MIRDGERTGLINEEPSAYLVTDHWVLVKVINDSLEDRERGGVAHLPEDVGKLMLQERVLVGEACRL